MGLQSAIADATAQRSIAYHDRLILDFAILLGSLYDRMVAREIMSELPNRITEIPVELPPSSKEKRGVSLGEPPTLLARLVFILMFILLIFSIVALSPRLAKDIAYSWNTGIERAKAEAAQKFLADHPLIASEQRIAWVAKAVAPSVVGIYTLTTRPSAERGRGGSDTYEPGIGSGVIVDAQGYVLTNFHVIDNAHLILVRLSDGREVEATVVGRDRSADIAVLRIDMDDIESVSWGDSRHVAVGEQVLAIGNPYGLQQTVTSGIISATERAPALSMLGTRRGRRLPQPQEFLQTDAAINPGNSGGALVDMNGKLIGINTFIIAAQNGGNTGIGFAIPSFVAKRIYDEIVSQGAVQHGWIGVDLDRVTPLQLQQMNQKKPAGAVVVRPRNRSPAREAGIQDGDIILRWGETEIIDPLYLIHAVLLSKPGTTETVEIFRDGELLKLDVTVGVRPTDL